MKKRNREIKRERCLEAGSLSGRKAFQLLLGVFMKYSLIFSIIQDTKTEQTEEVHVNNNVLLVSKFDTFWSFYA